MKAKTGRPKKEIKKSEAMRVRLVAEEKNALQGLADNLGVKPSRIVRRLIREAVSEGPDFFDDGINELREANRQLAAVGRNFNRTVKLMNRNEPLNSRDYENEYKSLMLGYEDMQKAYQLLISKSKNRSVESKTA